MKTCLMTHVEAQQWKAQDIKVRDAIRYRAQRMADESGETVEICTDDSKPVYVVLSQYPLAERPTKRTHGPCICGTGLDVLHKPECPALYPAQPEPDALTRLARYLRESTLHEVEKDEALSLISEAREEQRKARNDGLEQGARWVWAQSVRTRLTEEALSAGLDILKDPEP